MMPWEKYQTKPADGPWAKYRAATENKPVSNAGASAYVPTDTGGFFETAKSDVPNPANITTEDVKKGASMVARPLLEAGGAVGGGILGSSVSGGIPTPTTLIGSGLGYAIGANAADRLDELMGMKEPMPLSEIVKQSVTDIPVGASYEAGGQSLGPLLGGVSKAVGKVAKPLLGKMSGVGESAISEAMIASKSFDKALRGKITGEEIVNNAKSALTTLKDQRATAYQSSLKEISKNSSQIDTAPMLRDLSSLMSKYNVKIDSAGKIDTSRIAMGKTGRNDVEEIIQTVVEWGKKPGDNTATGLDVLKRQLDDFYSDSSQARQFVSSIRNSVKDTITKSVPEYDKMVKGYSEATKLIKDVESGLMMRKQGISGRIVADQTLRRLMSSMKDNFPLRKELVDLLGNKGGGDLAGEIAGFTMRTPMPVGLAGTGPALAAQAAYSMVNPSFWPVLAASSPRVQAEFLRVIGKGLGQAVKISPAMLREGVKLAFIQAENK